MIDLASLILFLPREAIESFMKENIGFNPLLKISEMNAALKAVMCMKLKGDGVVALVDDIACIFEDMGYVFTNGAVLHKMASRKSCSLLELAQAFNEPLVKLIAIQESDTEDVISRKVDTVHTIIMKIGGYA